MKLSSSTTLCLDGNLTNTHNSNSTNGCLSAILRRFVCNCSSPTYPSTTFNKETNLLESQHHDQNSSNIGEKIDDEAPSATSPGIVARLMGLETMPDLKLVPTTRSFSNSIGRSKSVNSIHNYWSEFDPTQVRQQWVRTCSSFREMGSREFPLSSFENGDETQEVEAKVRMKQEKTERREKVIEKNKNEDQMCRKVISTETNKRGKMITNGSCRKIGEIKVLGSVSPQKKDVCRKTNVALKAKPSSKPRNHKEVPDVAKLEKKKKIRRSSLTKVEPECSFENASSVSVLDLNDSLIEAKTLFSAKEDSITRRNSNSRRKLSPNLVKSDYPSPNFVRVSISAKQKPRSINGKCIKSARRDCYTRRDCIEIWRDVCKLTQEDMKKSNWMTRERWKLEDLEGILIEFGLQIFDRLVHEVVTELAEFQMENFAFVES